MTIGKQLQDVLTLIAGLTNNDINKDLPHTRVLDLNGLPQHETHRYIHELESLGLVRIQPRINRTSDEKGREYRLISITKEGLQELSSDKHLDNNHSRAKS
jgi:DNA-binding IclR family transcriptional regulator